MGFFIKLRKKKPECNNLVVSRKEPDPEHLDEDCELPWGWINRNREFTEKIQKEFSYFLNAWIQSRGKEPLREYEALKSLILYIEDAQKLCESMSECHVKWFSDCIADSDYLLKRKADLKNLDDFH